MVQIFCYSISQWDNEQYQHFFDRATPERRRRAERYHREMDRYRCVASDLLLRQALGGVVFTEEREAAGKPWIREYPEFQYSLSHSGEWVVLAFGPSPVGVDVQHMDWDPGKEQMARRWFAPEEQEYVFREEPDRCLRFYEIWTGKESWLKYLGTGIRQPLNSFSILSGAYPRRITHRPDDRHFLTLYTQEADCAISVLNGKDIEHDYHIR